MELSTVTLDTVEKVEIEDALLKIIKKIGDDIDESVLENVDTILTKIDSPFIAENLYEDSLNG